MIPQAKSLKALTQSEYILLVNKYLHMDLEELQDCHDNRYLPTLDHIVIRIITKALKTGDVMALEGLLQRVIGKSFIKPKLIDVEEPSEKKNKTFQIEIVESGVKTT